jgi:hypothetical protein
MNISNQSFICGSAYCLSPQFIYKYYQFEKTSEVTHTSIYADQLITYRKGQLSMSVDRQQGADNERGRGGGRD